VLSVISLIGVVAAATSGEAFASTASHAAYGPPPVTTTVPPGGFTAVVTTVTIRPAGGTIGPLDVDGVSVDITIPRGTFSRLVEITVTAPDLTAVTPQAGFTIVAGVGIRVIVNGSPYTGTFLNAITVAFRSSEITASSEVVVWNGKSFLIDPDYTTGEGVARVSFGSADSDFAVASPVGSAMTQVPGATTPVTGKPLLGEGILAGALVLAGAGGVAASRRRRSALPAAPLPIHSVTATQKDGAMQGSGPRFGAVIVIGALTAATLTACSGHGGGQQAQTAQQGPPPAAIKAQQIIATPKDLLAAAPPQSNGALWALAGNATSKSLFEINLPNGTGFGSIPVSNAAQSVTESLADVVGVALGTGRTGALELLDGSTGQVTRTIPLGAPARAVVAGSDGVTFYVLNGTPKSSSVTIVNSRNDAVQGTVPVPLDTISIAPDTAGESLYALQPNGLVTQIALAGGKIMSSFPVGSAARSLALSPDGNTLYVLKDSGPDVNVAAMNLATESVQRVLPAPANSLQVLVSPDGAELYQVVGTPTYGNIQVFAS
jgi:hypothetical protein